MSENGAELSNNELQNLVNPALVNDWETLGLAHEGQSTGIGVFDSRWDQV